MTLATFCNRSVPNTRAAKATTNEATVLKGEFKTDGKNETDEPQKAKTKKGGWLPQIEPEVFLAQKQFYLAPKRFYLAPKRFYLALASLQKHVFLASLQKHVFLASLQKHVFLASLRSRRQDSLVHWQPDPRKVVQT